MKTKDIELEAIKTMAKEFTNLIRTMINMSNFDRTKKARVVGHLEGKFYKIQLDGQVYKAYSPSFTYNENDIVYVKIASNNYNNLIIECAIK